MLSHRSKNDIRLMAVAAKGDALPRGIDGAIIFELPAKLQMSAHNKAIEVFKLYRSLTFACADFVDTTEEDKLFLKSKDRIKSILETTKLVIQGFAPPSVH